MIEDKIFDYLIDSQLIIYTFQESAIWRDICCSGERLYTTNGLIPLIVPKVSTGINLAKSSSEYQPSE